MTVKICLATNKNESHMSHCTPLNKNLDIKKIAFCILSHNKKLDLCIRDKIGGEISPTPGENKSFSTAVAYCTYVPGITYIYASCA